MRRYVSFIVILAFLVVLAGCTGTSPTSIQSSEGESSSIKQEEPSGAAAPISPSESIVPEVVNQELLNLLGKENAQLKEKYEGNCYADVNGMGAAMLEYYEPYLGFVFDPTADPMSDVWNGKNEKGECQSNPFADGLTIAKIILQENMEPSTPTVITQNSIHQLFQTEREITYSFLCEELEQEPTLQHVQDVFYTPLKNAEDREKSMNEPGKRIEGGVYRAEFVLEAAQIEVSFVKSDEAYIAYYAMLQLHA